MLSRPLPFGIDCLILLVLMVKQAEPGDVAVGRGLDPRDHFGALQGAEQVGVAG